LEIIKTKVQNENLAKQIYEKVYRNFIESIGKKKREILNSFDRWH
jgi:hypothetical protein